MKSKNDLRNIMVYNKKPEKWRDFTKNLIKVHTQVRIGYENLSDKITHFEVAFEYKKKTYRQKIYPSKYNEEFLVDSVYDNEECNDEEIDKILMKLSPIQVEDLRLGGTCYLHYYRGEWFHTTRNIKEEDVKTLINDTELRNKEKLEKQIQRARNRLENQEDNISREAIPDDVQIFVWNRDRGKCVKCQSNKNLEYDHIIPFSKGGSNTARNLQLLCKKCNREKGDMIG